MGLFGRDDTEKLTRPTPEKILRKQAQMADDYWARLKKIDGITEARPFSFIYEIKNNLSTTLCNTIIEMFEKHPELQAPGKTVSGANLNMKRSMDLAMTDEVLKDPAWKSIDKELIKRVKNGANKLWDLFPEFYKLSLGLEAFQIQKTYQDVLGFNWHIDAGLGSAPTREWAIIWYLNDIDQGGTTDFMYYDIQVKPEQGKLVFFPTSWMHLHNAKPPVGKDKYIITSMFCRN